MPPWGLNPTCHSCNLGQHVHQHCPTNICLLSGTEGVLKIQSEPQIYGNKAVLTQADLHSRPPSTHTLVHGNKSAHLAEAAAHFPLTNCRWEGKSPSLLLHHRMTQFSSYLWVKSFKSTITVTRGTVAACRGIGGSLSAWHSLHSQVSAPSSVLICCR